MSVTIPQPNLYLPLTYAPTDTSLGLTTSTTAPSYNSNNGLVFDDLYTKPGAGPVWGSSKFLNIPWTAPPVPTSTTGDTGITVCFCMNLNNYFPGTSIHILSMGRKSSVATQANVEPLTLYYNSRKQLTMTLDFPSGTSPNNGNVLQTGYNQNNTLPLTSNTWFMVAYTISLSSSSSNTQKISLYLGNSITNVVGLSNGNNNSGYGQDNIGVAVNLNSTTPNLLYNDIQLGDRFNNLNNNNNTGYGLNGCIRDFMIFNKPLTLNQLKVMSARLPAPGTAFPVTATANGMPTINPQFPSYSALQSLIHYIPPTIVSLPLTTSPTTGTSSGSIVYGSSGAVFSNNSSPTLEETTSNSYINIPVPTSGNTITNNKFTVSFPVYLNYLNNKPLRILTLGNSGTTNEVLSIISQYVAGTGNQVVTNTTCSTTSSKQYYIGAIVNNTGTMQNTIIDEDSLPPPPSATNIYKGRQFPVNECTWNLVSLVLDGTNISLFINDNICTTVPIPTGFSFNTFRIGDSFANNSQAFVGTIKNFMVWNIPFNTNYNNTYPNIIELKNKYILNTPTATVALHFNQNDIPLLEDENITETFVNIQPSNKFLKYAKLYSIVGILFYAILLLGNINYQHIVPNKNVSFALNVLLVICAMVSLTN